MAFFDQFTTKQMRKQYGRCLPGLKSMLDKAERTGKKVNGYTAEQLKKHIEHFSTCVEKRNRD